MGCSVQGSKINETETDFFNANDVEKYLRIQTTTISIDFHIFGEVNSVRRFKSKISILALKLVILEKSRIIVYAA